jgi:ribosomal protein S18 acetylase RimI-like enzyme
MRVTTAPSTQIAPARFPEDADAVRAILREYAAAIQVELCFQGFDAELAGLPGKYGPPSGSLLIVRGSSDLAAIIALRDLGSGSCEMKRLYVRPAHRGQGLGRRLVQSLIAEARRLGYRTMKLDTAAHLIEAQRLYESLGFCDIPRYYDNLTPGARFMELSLQDTI